MCRHIPGGLGQRIRAIYWRRRFRTCGRVRIDEGVIFHNPEQIEIGDDVWIMAYSVLTAPVPSKADASGKENCPSRILKIGSQVQIGLFNVINGTGGLDIGDCATLSARVSIYSATHLPRDPADPSVHVGCNGMVAQLPVHSKQRQMVIGEGAWVGLHAAVICCDLGPHAFVTSGAVVWQDVPSERQVLPDGTVGPRYFQRRAA